MAAYHFVTKWRIPAPVERVWDVLDAPERYQDWWPMFVAYNPLTPELRGVGARAERVVRGVLPYQLRYVTTTTKVDPPRELAYDSTGDLTGDGRFLLTPVDGATEVTFFWDVSTNKTLMNMLTPLFRPLFEWHHNWVMKRGERGLVRLLKDSA
jgi:uncharacterized protein YndB with AHSA1/START domain